MNVCMITYEFPPFGRGGVGSFTFRLARNLSTLGLNIHVIAPGPNRNISQVKPVEESGVTIHRTISEMSTSYRSYREKREVGNYIIRLNESEGFDLIHSIFALPTGQIGALVAGEVGVPLIVSLRGSDVESMRYSTERLPALKWVLEQACYVTSVNSDLLYKAQLIGNIENATVIHNALDPSLFANVSLVRLAVNQKRSDRKFIERFLALKTKEKIIIGTAGRLGHVKGTTYLFEAFAKLVKRYSHLHLLLVGEFADLNEKKEWSKWLKKKKLWNHITFTGWIPHPFICAWLHEMDIFVFPSLHEGSPNALLEAMFCGLPIVATDVCGNRDVIDDGKDGFLVASHDADELADKIGILVEDESERSFFGKNTQEKIKKDYTVEKERESWLEIYNQLTRG